MAEAGALSASLTLRFEDLVSPALKAVMAQFRELRDLTARLNIGKLASDTQKLPQVTGQVKGLANALGPLPDILKRINFGQMAQGAERVPWLTQGLDKIEGAAQRAGAALTRMWKSVSAGAGNALGNLKEVGQRMGAIGGAVAGVSLVAPVEHWAELSNILRHAAITEGKEGTDVEAEMTRLRTMFYQDALETGQSTRTIAQAYSDLIQQGIPPKMLDTVIRAHSMAATAYNISPEDLGPAVGALIQNLKVPESDIGGALAAMAVASREGRFKVTDFSRELPGVAAQMAGWGMQGRDAANIGFASLQTVMKNSSMPSQAATDFTDALNYMGRAQGQKRWKKDMGFDLMPFLTQARESGQDPVAAMMGALQTKMADMNIEQKHSLMGHLFGNIQAGDAWLALIQHAKEYQALLEKLRGVGPETLMKNFADAARDPTVQLRIFREMLSQLVDRLGDGFEPVLHALNAGLVILVTNFQAFQQEHPQITAAILGIAGVSLFLLTVLSAVGIAIVGLTTVGWPIALVVAGIAAVAAAAYEIYENWDGVVAFFQSVWEGIKSGWNDLCTAFRTVGNDIVQDIETAFAPLIQWFEDLWKKITAPFDAPTEKVSAFRDSTVGKALGLGTGKDEPDSMAAQKPNAGTIFDDAGRPIVQLTVNNALPGTTVTAPDATVKQTPAPAAATPDPGYFVGGP